MKSGSAKGFLEVGAGSKQIPNAVDPNEFCLKRSTLFGAPNWRAFGKFCRTKDVFQKLDFSSESWICVFFVW